jgi:hypothetical protein
VIQADGIAGPSLPPGTLFVTSLGPRAPAVLLNVSLGDQADARRRSRRRARDGSDVAGRGLVEIERRTAFTTASDKVLHLHVRAPAP